MGNGIHIVAIRSLLLSSISYGIFRIS
jgi:hypothetical protein